MAAKPPQTTNNMENVEIKGVVTNVRQYSFIGKEGKKISRIEVILLTEDHSLFLFSTEDKGQKVPEKGDELSIYVKVIPDWETMKPKLRVIPF